MAKYCTKWTGVTQAVYIYVTQKEIIFTATPGASLACYKTETLDSHSQHSIYHTRD